MIKYLQRLTFLATAIPILMSRQGDKSITGGHSTQQPSSGRHVEHENIKEAWS